MPNKPLPADTLFQESGDMRDPIKDVEAAKPGGGLMQDARVRRIAVYAGVLLAAFLLGLVPMWLTARERANERDQAQKALRISRLQNALANAALDARRGDYEPARQTTSDFFTDLREEIERGRDSAFNSVQQESLRGLLSARDDMITMLARGDSASVERLAELHANYRRIVYDIPVQQTNR